MVRGISEMKIGTAISHVATPIARLFNMPCVDPVTQNLRPESTCAKVAGHLDAGRWGDALYDFIWRKDDVKREETTTTMKEWVLIQQSGVQAETWQEAMSKLDEAEIISVTVQQRQFPATGTMMPARQVSPGVYKYAGDEPPTKSDKK